MLDSAYPLSALRDIRERILVARDNLRDRWVLARARAGKAHPELAPALLRDLLAQDVLLALQRSPLAAHLVLVGGGALRYCFNSPRVPHTLDLRGRDVLAESQQVAFEKALEQAARASGGEHVVLPSEGGVWSSELRAPVPDGVTITLSITCDPAGGAVGEPRPVTGLSGMLGLIATPTPAELLGHALGDLAAAWSAARIWDAYYLTNRMLAGGSDKEPLVAGGFDVGALAECETDLARPKTRDWLWDMLHDAVVPTSASAPASLDRQMVNVMADDVADLIRRLAHPVVSEGNGDRQARLAAWRKRHQARDE